MRINSLSTATAAIGLALGCAGAQAHASISGSFGGYDLSLNNSGFSWVNIDMGQSLEVGETATWTYEYAITLRNDGLSATRNWDYCFFLAPSPICGPSPNGQEQTEADFGYTASKWMQPGYHYELTNFPTLDPVSAAPGQTVTFAGSFTVVESRDDDAQTFTQLDKLYVYATMWLDSNDTVSAVPELPSAGLLLAGLAGLALRRRYA